MEDKVNLVWQAKIEKLSPQKGDLIVATVDIDKYNYEDCEDVYKVMRAVADSYGCESLMLAEGCGLTIADKVRIAELKKIVADWEAVNGECDINV